MPATTTKPHDMTHAPSQSTSKVLAVKQRVYSVMILVTMAAAVTTIWLALSQQDPLWGMHLFLQCTGLSLCVFFLIRIQNINKVEPSQKYMAACYLGYTYIWDLLNILFSRFPDDSVARENSIHMIGIALLAMSLQRKHMLPAVLSLFALHTGLTWANLALFGWQPDYGARIGSDLTSLVLVLVISLLATYANTLSDSENRSSAMETMALTDHLTQLPNRRSLQLSLQNYQDVSVALVDIDDFKQVNDTYGHSHGDTVLVHIAQTLTAAASLHGCVGRWGGEEFVIVMPNVSQREALIVSERARQAVETQASHPPVTVSIGVATRRADEPLAGLLHRCDALMYDAKRASKNCVRSDTTSSTDITDAELAHSSPQNPNIHASRDTAQNSNLDLLA